MGLKRSVFFSPVPYVICIMLLLGAIAGKWAGDQFRLFDEEKDMDAYMTVLMTQANRIVNSAKETLSKVNQSPYALCSSDDKRYMRELLFAAYHIKDIGRLEHDMLQCSTLLSDVVTTKPRSKEDVLLKDGVYVYKDQELITAGSHGPIFGRNTGNLVLSALAFDAVHVPQYDFAIFMTNSDRTQYAKLYSNPDAFPENISNSFIPTNSMRSFGVTNGVLQQKACDDETGVCVAIATSESWSDHTDELLPFVFTSLGLLVGGGVAIGWTFYRNRDRSLVSLLKKALKANELALVYQPVVNLGDEKIIGFEALIRWEITKGDFVPPDLFVARAEAAGVGHLITAYVLDNVIEEMGDLLRQQRALYINVNITSGDLQSPDFIQSLEARLSDAGIQPQQIGLELTERTAVDFAKASSGIKALREKGYKVYIDDFGTGYSSLAYLGELQVDAIKIDKAFTRTLGGEAETVSIVPQIIAMAHQYGLGIVVEGIETGEQVRCLRDICTNLSGQGWFFGKPVNASLAQSLAGFSIKKRKRTKVESSSK
ncbi:EAL domain-containing protein [Brucella pseudogrignonensis]|uniref:cyclic-guanylate-specific phosphodiesterase n=1 Tax=Brucella pseudogrignonensis TaxID=419475 RepID=A0ABU1M6U4_9HYPH|nr:EAL domain-containing protein [Brucella pseudogrignonensis]MDR6431547.1 sensor c-di-GMP phosphodiesterase-like protein [Brucella pseudogrignonensis]